MESPLLKTKFHIPARRREILPRPRLTQRLTRNIRRKLTCICAPAGFGKSEVLYDWMATNHPPAAFLSLDERDNSLQRFWRYFITAIQEKIPRVGNSALALIGSIQIDGTIQSASMETVITELINDLVLISDPLVLAIDDFNTIEEPAIHQWLSFFIDHQPAQIRLIIASRSEPSLPLNLLRANGQLCEFNATDLTFALEETTRFLNRFGIDDLPAKSVRLLQERTEGWIVGIRLAAVALRDSSDNDAFIQKLSGDHRSILDYLTDEVLSRQPPEIQRFLIETAILERMTGSLCEKVTGQPNGQDMLEVIERSNLFVMPLDDERRWYRYHHLFRNLLKNRLNHDRREGVDELHRRASEWFERENMPAEAIDHALAARDDHRASMLIERIDYLQMLYNDPASFSRWLQLLPMGLVMQSFRLSMSCAWSFYVAGKLDEVKVNVKNALGTLGIVNIESINWVKAYTGKLAEPLSEALALLTISGILRRDYTAATDITRQALDCLPQKRGLPRTLLAWAVGVQLINEGEPRDAYHALSEAKSFSLETGDDLTAATIGIHLSVSLILQGRLTEAADTLKDIRDWCAGHAASPFTIGHALAGLGWIHLEWHKLDTAEKYLNKSLNILLKGGYYLNEEAGYGFLAQTLLVRGETSGALEILKKARGLGLNSGAGSWADRLRILQVRCWMIQGKYEAIEQWIHERGISPETPAIYSNEAALLMAATIWISRRRHKTDKKALKWTIRKLEKLESDATASGRLHSSVQILISLSLAHRVAGDQNKAFGFLAQALTQAERSGLIHAFLREGKEMRTFLREASGLGISPVFVHKLQIEYKTRQNNNGHARLIDPLTDRELEVLRLIAAGLPNKEIAGKLSVSLNTIKTHTTRIYSKLGVNSRSQAAIQARERKLW
ncbi:MAG: hypothetical protein HKM93_09545 [Desulfobacteraceae bacterium]|nr:hypothetical protein [Desulfobacteraceae bacterium]